MDDPFDTGPRGPGISIGRLILNLLTVIVLLMTLAVAAGFGMLLVDPAAAFNPFPAPTLPATLGPPTATTTPAIYLPTEIPPTSTPRPLPTAAPAATETLQPTDVPEFTATLEGSPEATAEPGAQFELQTGSPAYLTDPRGCEHMGVGGKVYDAAGASIVNLLVRISGELAGTPIGPLDTITGSASDRFGFGGYYFELADTPTASEDTLQLQVLDASGLALSEQVSLTTYENCEQNLVFVTWTQAES